MQKKIAVWIKKHENVLAAAFMALLPILSCLAACAMEGRSISEVYLPASEWNDELIYYKLVEGIVNFGCPQGYFGFNESHSMAGSYAAWSPVLVWPWVLWGLLFGWNLLSPIVCNIVLLSLAMFLYVWLVRPTKKQLGILTILFVAFTPFTRYMMAGMPEVICFAMVIVTYALAVNYLQKEQAGKLAVLFVLTALMTLMRPYLIVFMLLPMYFLFRKKKWLGLLLNGVILGVTAIAYVLIKKYMSAEYFDPLFRTDFITAFWDKGFFGGMKNLIYQIAVKSKEYFAMLYEGFLSGLAAGAFFGGFWVMLLILAVQTLYNYRKKQKEEMILNGSLVLCFFAMWMALLLMYKPFEGSKHLLTFMAVGIFAISRMETVVYKKAMVTAGVCVYLYGFWAEAHPMEFQIPYSNAELVAQMEGWQEIFAEELVLTDGENPSFDNTVIWTLYDNVGEEKVLTMTPWQYLYGLPEGFGINCCYGEYVMAHFAEIQSRYLVVIPGGDLESFLAQKGVEKIAQKDNVALYRLR